MTNKNIKIGTIVISSSYGQGILKSFSEDGNLIAEFEDGTFELKDGTFDVLIN